MRSAILIAGVATASAANSTIIEIPHTQPSGASVGLNTTFHYNSAACDPSQKKPLSILLNGAPVLARQYADLANRMADQGYFVAIPEYSERGGQPLIVDPTCPVQDPPFPSASNANSINAYIAAESPDFLSCVDTDSIILVGHSAGAGAVFTAASGGCAGFAGAFIPFCEGYAPMLDADGVDKVKGVLAFEGTGAGEQELIPGVWAGLVTSTYGDEGDEYQSKFSKVTADKKYLLSYKNMNHYSVNNWNEGDDAPCGGPRVGAEANFVEDKPNHVESTLLIADAFVHIANAFMFEDEAGLAFLGGGAAENPRYSLSSTCPASGDPLCGPL